MSWFSGVPHELTIAGTRFLLAAEVLEEELRLDPQQDPIDQKVGERPSTDWAATSLFVLARIQLDQVVQILRAKFSIDAGTLSGSEVSRRLEERFEQLHDLNDEEADVSFEVAVVGEAVDLWRALNAAETVPVGHGFASDGSISISTGPDLPELNALGLRASNAGELNVSPLDVWQRASACTREAGRLAVRWQQLDGQQGVATIESARADGWPKSEAESASVDGLAIRARARAHFSVWWHGSEYGFVSWAADFLDDMGLLAVDDPVARARAEARLMSLWALHIEFAACSGEGAVGDWRYEVGRWVGDGISQESLLLLNEIDELGWDTETAVHEPSLRDICASVVEQYYPEVVTALMKDLGDAFTFAYFWATRLDDVDYPLAAELVGAIVNDEAVLADDPQNKMPAFMWVQSGMDL